MAPLFIRSIGGSGTTLTHAVRLPARDCRPMPDETAIPPPPDLQQRRRTLAHRFVRIIAISYAIDAAFLAAFGVLGSVDMRAAMIYGAGGAVHVALFTAFNRSRMFERLNDHQLTALQMFYGLMLQLSLSVLYPPIGGLMLLVIFLVLGFSALTLDSRQALGAWAGAAVGIGLVLIVLETRPQLPSASAAERTLSWLFIALVLGRSMYLGTLGREFRLKLEARNRALTVSLAEIHRLATTDELTGCLNRRSLMEALSNETARIARYGRPACIAALDLDHFKLINDRHGHAAGDRVLREFAALVKARLRTSDFFGRLGGEEFLVLLTETESAAGVLAMDRLRRAVADHPWHQAYPGLRVTVSIGVARWRRGESADDWLGRADLALYAAKGGGRDRVHDADGDTEPDDGATAAELKDAMLPD